VGSLILRGDQTAGGLTRSVATSTRQAACGYHELVLARALMEQEGEGHGLAVVNIS
jgi:hypothetical protein